MSHHDSGWRPDTVQTYDDFEVWDHGVWASDVNCEEDVDDE